MSEQKCHVSSVHIPFDYMCGVKARQVANNGCLLGLKMQLVQTSPSSQYAALRRINPRKKRTKYLIKLRSLIHSQCHGMIHDFHVVERVAHGSPPTLGIQILGSCCLMSQTDMPRQTDTKGRRCVNE